MQNKVEIIITTDSKGAITGVTQTGDAVKKLESSVTGLTASLGDVAKGLAAFYGIREIVQGISTAVKESLRFLGQMETSALGIASAYMVGGKYIDETTGKALEGEKALQAAQAESKQMLDELQVANLQTIATLDQLVRAYQETLPVAMAKGFNKQMAKDFTVAMVQAAGAIGLSLDQMGEETRSILTGNINPRTSRIATVLGLRNEDIKKVEGDAQKLFDFLMRRLDAYKIAGMASQSTWAGLWSNVKDIALQAGGKMFEPLFEAIKRELSDITNKIVTIDEKTRTIKWSEDFLGTVNKIKEVLGTVIDDVTRLAMLLDKAGGTMTAIMHYGTLAEYRASFGIWKGAGESAEKWKQYNKMYEERYKTSERALYIREVERQGQLKLASQDKLEALAYTTPRGAGLVELRTESGQKVYFEPNTSAPGGKGYKPNPTNSKGDKGGENALNTWAAKMRDLDTDMQKALFPDDKLARNLEDIKNKYDDLIAQAAKYAKEHGVGFDTSKVEKWRQVMEKAAKEADAEKKLKVWTDVEQQITDRTVPELEKRLAAEDQWVKDSQEKLKKAGFSHEEISEKMVQVTAAAAEEKKKIELDYINTVMEAESRRYLSQLDMMEKDRSGSKLDITRQRISVYQSLLSSYQQNWENETDPTAKILWADKINEARSKLVDLNITLKEQEGLFTEGLGKGLRDYLWDMKSVFQQGVEIARDTAQAMESAFSDFFFDAFQGKLQDLADYVTSFSNAVQRSIANALGQQVSTGITSLVQGLFSATGSLSSTVTGSFGIPASASYVPGVHHAGGIVRRYVPVFHGGGVNTDERVVINKVGERYITEEQNSWLTRIAQVAGSGERPMNVRVVMENQTGVAMESEQKDVNFNLDEIIIRTVVKRAKASKDFRSVLATGGRQ